MLCLHTKASSYWVGCLNGNAAGVLPRPKGLMVHAAEGCLPVTRTLPSLTLTSPQNQVALSSDVNPSLCLGKEVQWSLTVFVTTAAVSAGQGWRATLQTGCL